ncbi:Ig-like domain-containing protein [Paenibacillus aquistagni]|uniref:Ig-like domain-containing protein n=1 Tax=Paenibacillus aquistagni TaxID=1852522 RepID=UPI0021669130|nr:Ig-like domain-containing protein [Paenibacillus aquistagni]
MNVRKKAMPWLSMLLVVALMAGLLPAGKVTHAAESVTGIRFESNISPVYVLVEGQSTQLKVIATIKDGTTEKESDVTDKVSWTSSDSKIVSVDAGWVKGVGKGSAEITAKYQGYTIKKMIVADMMYEKLVVRTTDGGQEVPSELTVNLGMKPKWSVFALDHQRAGESNVTEEATWSSSNTSVADVNKGVITLKEKGETEITVKHKGLSYKVKLKVDMPYNELKIMPDKVVEFTFGDSSKSVTVIATKPDGSTEDVTALAEWSSSDKNVVEVENGVLKPINVGTATITVSYLGKTDTVTAVVRASNQAMRITPDKKQYVMLSQGVVSLQTFVLAMDNSTKEVTQEAEWTSSNVQAVTVDKGMVRLHGAGDATITAKYQGLSRKVDITVYPSITKIEWAEAVKPDKDGDTKRKEEMFINDVKSLPKIQGTTFSGEKVDVSNVVQWTSDNPNIVKIEEDGKMKALETGTVRLVAQVSGQILDMDVTVTRKALILHTDQDELSLVTAREVSVPTVTVIYTDGEEADVTNDVKWESSSNNLLVYDGKMRGLVPTSRLTLNGTFSNVKLSIKVTIEEEIVSLTIDPNPVYTTINKSESVKVTGKYRNGKTINLSSRMNWKMENESIATVKGSSVKGAALGSTKMVGEFQGKTYEVPVHVKPKLLKLEGTPSSIKLTPGQSAAWKVQAIYDTGEVVDVTSQVTWVPSNTKVKVSRGSVQGVSKGSTSIKISFGGKSTTIRTSVK